MGLVAKDDTLAEKFYSDLKSTLDKFKGMDFVITGDFNAKLGTKLTVTTAWAHTGEAQETRMEIFFTNFFQIIN